jgi:hypothetical protein
MASSEVAAGSAAAGRSRQATDATQTGGSSATTATGAAEGSEVRHIVIPRWNKDRKMSCLATVTPIATSTTNATVTAGSSGAASAAVSDAVSDALAPAARAAGPSIPAASAIPGSSTLASVATLPTFRYQLEVRRVGVRNRERLVVRISSIFSFRAIPAVFTC